ncbi:hypothetical protein [Sediminivirga luteola]|uniref:Uncharacterized protein n=1 Tax=Sediminivirga luteola TaxID=1774748 RepID=A0A8J2XJI3_9MICO|nr:hypothetical protein [Sediminivirga luteola]GGA05703.1 hypothetical protein GCM10011333_05690 [Sediminivirga luteola]
MHTIERTEIQNPHLLLLGDAAERLEPVALFIEDHGGAATRLAPGVPGAAPETSAIREAVRAAGAPVSCAIVAETFDPGCERGLWWQHAEHTSRLIDSLLTGMANPSNVLLVAFGSSNRRRDRALVRRALDRIVAQFSSHAAADFALDLNVNAIEVPPGAERPVLLKRLAGFARHRTAACSDSVLRYEEITDSSIRCALANFEI